MKRWILANVAFIASSLVAAGSIITQEDLGKVKITDDAGKEKLVNVKPPHDAIEIDENGNPVDKRQAEDLANLIGSLAIHAGGAAAPAQTPGGVSLAANQLTPAITAGHANLADALVDRGAAHATDPTVGTLSPEVIAELTSNPEFMAALAAQISGGGAAAPAPAAPAPVAEEKPAAGANAQTEAPKRRGAAEGNG